jgi:hypothetical protein
MLGGGGETCVSMKKKRIFGGGKAAYIQILGSSLRECLLVEQTPEQTCLIAKSRDLDRRRPSTGVSLQLAFKNLFGPTRRMLCHRFHVVLGRLEFDCKVSTASRSWDPPFSNVLNISEHCGSIVPPEIAEGGPTGSIWLVFPRLVNAIHCGAPTQSIIISFIDYSKYRHLSNGAR